MRNCPRIDKMCRSFEKMLMILCPWGYCQSWSYIPHQPDGLPLEAAFWHGISGGMLHGGDPFALYYCDSLTFFWRHLGPLFASLCLMQHIFDLGIKRTDLKCHTTTSNGFSGNSRGVRFPWRHRSCMQTLYRLSLATCFVCSVFGCL